MTNWLRLDDRPPGIGAIALAGVVDGWATASPGRLSRRLAHRLRSAIRAGLLDPGTRLPPERSLAAALGVSRATVVAALDELRADGLVSSRHGSGTVVTAAAGRSVPAGLTFAEAALADHRAINLAVSAPADASALGDLALSVADLVSVDPAHGYAPAGLPSLRAALAARHTAAGLPTSADGIHVTNGAQHALALILAAHCRPGDAVAVEDPTYVGLNDVAAALGLRLVPLPGDLAGGPDPDHLVPLCRSRRVRAAVLLPAVHSPTGRRPGSGVRAALAAALDACPEILVVEDNTLADLSFRAGRRPPSLARLCEAAPVVSVETLSKVAWGGLRIGWLRARPALLAPVTARRAATDLGSPVPSQVLAARLLDRLDEMIAGRRAVLARRAATLTRLLRAAVPDWTFPAPAGGLSLWVDLGPAVTADRFADTALAHGVAVAPGTSACVARSGDHHLRLCFDRPEAELTLAAERLAAAWSAQGGKRQGGGFSSSRSSPIRP
jgi:DNA-binding transcriptional MocR family regulator